MKIITDYDSPFSEPIGLAASLGFFDGLHIGHMKIIKASIDSGFKRAVITFSNSPKTFIDNKAFFFRIISEEEKIQLLENEGIDYLISLPFDERMMQQTKEEFFEHILVHFNVKKVIAGYNFSFGKNKEGNADELIKLSERYNMQSLIIPEVKIDGETVSSTAIRNAIRFGDYDKVERMLGRSFEI